MSDVTSSTDRVRSSGCNRSDDYISLVCNEMLNTLVEHDLVDAVDVFCEDIGFSYAQTQRVFDAAKKL